MLNKLVAGYLLVVSILIGTVFLSYKPSKVFEECKIASESKEIPKCEVKFNINAPGFTM